MANNYSGEESKTKMVDIGLSSNICAIVNYPCVLRGPQLSNLAGCTHYTFAQSRRLLFMYVLPAFAFSTSYHCTCAFRALPRIRLCVSVRKFRSLFPVDCTMCTPIKYG